MTWLWFALFFLVVTQIGLYTAAAWQGKITWLAGQYLLAFIFVAQSWPWTTAASKLLAGWMSLVILSASLLTRPAETSVPPLWRLFRGLTALSIAALSIYAAFQAPGWLPGKNPFVLGSGLALIAVNLVQFGLQETLLETILGLLGLLAGFEILYAAIETSLLINLGLSAVTLGLALTGAYLLNRENADSASEEETP